MEPSEPTPTENGDLCHMAGCQRKAVVWLSGRALCAQHYVHNLNEVNDLGLTPRNLAGGDDADVPAAHREERISSQVQPPRTAETRTPKRRRLR